MLRYSRRSFALGIASSILGVSASGCGTLLYPERRGQPKGQLDWGVVALDGLGLLLFVVPGVVAFAVDFWTGAIYLPSGTIDGYSSAESQASDEFSIVKLPREQLTDDGIETAVSEHIGRQISLSEPRCRRRPLKNLKQFWGAHDRLVAELGPLPNSSPNTVRAQSR